MQITIQNFNFIYMYYAAAKQYIFSVFFLCFFLFSFIQEPIKVFCTYFVNGGLHTFPLVTKKFFLR